MRALPMRENLVWADPETRTYYRISLRAQSLQQMRRLPGQVAMTMLRLTCTRFRSVAVGRPQGIPRRRATKMP